MQQGHITVFLVIRGHVQGQGPWGTEEGASSFRGFEGEIKTVAYAWPNIGGSNRQHVTRRGNLLRGGDADAY
jgi:hypothetical protein